MITKTHMIMGTLDKEYEDGDSGCSGSGGDDHGDGGSDGDNYNDGDDDYYNDVDDDDDDDDKDTTDDDDNEEEVVGEVSNHFKMKKKPQASPKKMLTNRPIICKYIYW